MYDCTLYVDTVNAVVSLRPTETMVDIAVMEDPLGFTNCSINKGYCTPHNRSVESMKIFMSGFHMGRGTNECSPSLPLPQPQGKIVCQRAQFLQKFTLLSYEAAHCDTLNCDQTFLYVGATENKEKGYTCPPLAKNYNYASNTVCMWIGTFCILKECYVSVSVLEYERILQYYILDY